MPDISPRILLGAPAGFRPNQHAREHDSARHTRINANHLEEEGNKMQGSERWALKMASRVAVALAVVASLASCMDLPTRKTQATVPAFVTALSNLEKSSVTL